MGAPVDRGAPFPAASPGQRKVCRRSALPQHNDIVQVLAGIPADAPDDAGFNEKEEQQADIKAYFQKPPYKSRDFMEEGKAMPIP